MQVFSKEWFQTHQSKLLFLLNWKVTKSWFRWILRIRPSDVGFNNPIIELTPSSYTVFLGYNKDKTMRVVSDFRTHDKFAKRLYYSFREFWYLAHFWDWAMADRWAPKLSFGFDTLTSYPDPSFSGPTSCSGLVERFVASETFATIRDGAGTDVTASAGNSHGVFLIGSSTTNQYQDLGRLIHTFDTSIIGGLSVVSSVAIAFYAHDIGKHNGLGTTNMHITDAFPLSNTSLVAGDFTRIRRVSFDFLTYAEYTAGVYNSCLLDNAGEENVNCTGITRFACQLEWDLDNNFTGAWANGVATLFRVASANTSGTSQDPKLDVTYNIHPMNEETFRCKGGLSIARKLGGF